MAILTETGLFALKNRRDGSGRGHFHWPAARFLRPRINIVLLLALFLAGPAGQMKAQIRPPAFNATQLKAAFLLNFGQFVKWPPEAFTNDDSPVIIGILGADPFGPLLDELVRSEKVEKRRLEVVRFRRVEDIKTTHVLFIGASETSRIEEILRALDGKPILTVGETEGFARRGGMIRFLTENRKIRLRINLEAARENQIQISSKLLRPAEIVSGKEGR